MEDEVKKMLSNAVKQGEQLTAITVYPFLSKWINEIKRGDNRDKVIEQMEGLQGQLEMLFDSKEDFVNMYNKIVPKLCSEKKDS